MIREDSYKIIQEKQEIFSQQLQKQKQSEGTITILRAVTFIAGFCFIAIGISDNNSLWIIGAALLLCFMGQ